MASQTKFILLTLGEELLLGLTANGHLTYIGDQLRQGGATLHANITLSDTPEDIDEHFRHYWQKADVLITTGGLGPTVDDRTKEIIADVLEEELVFDPAIMKTIEDRFALLGLQMTENNRKQAYRFSAAQVLPNPNGTAPGLWLEKEGKTLIMLPGPPKELQPMFEDVVIPRLKERALLESQTQYLQLRTAGVGESALETLLQPLFEPHPDLQVAYCAHPGMVDFRISFPDTDNAYDRLIEIAYDCRTLLGDDFVCCGNDTLTQTVSNILARRNLTLATAESCTGGLIANEITNIPGSSRFYKGGYVTYTNQSKEESLNVPADMIQQHSEVSMEVAIAMAVGVSERMESDFAISTTGYLGPSGGTEQNPVGTVFVGMHSPRGTWGKRLFYRGHRVAIKQRVFNASMDWLRRELLANEKEDDKTYDQLKAESDKILRSLR